MTEPLFGADRLEQIIPGEVNEDNDCTANGNSMTYFLKHDMHAYTMQSY